MVEPIDESFDYPASFGGNFQAVLGASPLDLPPPPDLRKRFNEVSWGLGSRLVDDLIELLEQPTTYLTPALVQSQTTSGSAVSTLTATAWSPATTAGSTLVFAVSWSNPGTPTVVTPPSGYTLIGSPVVGTGVTTATYYKANCSASEAAPAITLSATCYIKIITAEYSNLALSSVLDQNSNNTGSGTSASTAAVTTTQSYEVQFAALGTDTPAASVGPTICGTGADDNSNGGTRAWANPARITAEDASTSDASAFSTEETDYLKATNFGFSIPSTAVIQGILVEFKKTTPGGGPPNAKDVKVRIVKGGAIGATDRADTATAWPAALTWVSHGSATDLWGEVWTPANINASTFGTVISAKGTAASPRANASIDAVRITVYYGIPPALTSPTNGYSVVQNIASDGLSGAFALAHKIATIAGSTSSAMAISQSQNWAAKEATLFALATGFPLAPSPTRLRLYAKDRAGISGLYFKDDAGNEYDLTAPTPAAHGASLHTDLTRSIWVPRENLILDSGTAVTIGAVPDAVSSVNLADAATQGFYFAFMVPRDWASGTISAVLYWSPGSTDAVAHTVRWQFVAKERSAGNDLTAAGTTTAWTGSSAARTVSTLVIETSQAVLTPTAALNEIQLNVRRLGSDAADTYVGAVRVIGVRLDYTATQ